MAACDSPTPFLCRSGNTPEKLEAGASARVEERDAARAAKDFARSDATRDELAAQGIELLDTPQGTRWKRS